MLRKNLSDDTQASLNSAMIWSLLAILFITAAVPASLFATNQIQDLSSDESYFSPENAEDFGTEGIWAQGYATTNSKGVGILYAYNNITEELQTVADSGLYTKDQTGNDYHEYLVTEDPDDTDGFDTFSRLTIALNTSVDEAISEDLKRIDFEGEFSRNGTVNIEVQVRDDEDYTNAYTLNEKEFDVSTNRSTYSIDIDYSKLLDADASTSGETNIQLSIQNGDSEDQEMIQPADSLKFNIDLIHSTSAMSTFWTVNVASGLLGGFLMIAAVFSTPWVDLRDLTGRFY